MNSSAVVLSAVEEALRRSGRVRDDRPHVRRLRDANDQRRRPQYKRIGVVGMGAVSDEEGLRLAGVAGADERNLR